VFVDIGPVRVNKPLVIPGYQWALKVNKKNAWIFFISYGVGSRWGNRKVRDHWGDLGVDGWIILGWISRKWDVGIWTGLGWPRIETGGGRL